MPFHSLTFLTFFLLVVILYYLITPKYRWLVLLSSGMIFYAWLIPAYLIVAALMMAGTWLTAIGAEKYAEKGKSLIIAWGITLILILLISFKYTAFLSANLEHLAAAAGLHYPLHIVRWILPLGISFQSFMAISYLLEVKRGNIKAERHPGIFALYLMFFPVLASGPIERPQHLLPQFRETHRFDVPGISSGLRLMIWGFFKKLVIADRLGVFVNIVYQDAQTYQGLPLIWATFFFMFQVYVDFSAYTDIARGSAKVLGFRLSENFNSPYFSTSVTEFWRRWHMSLSGWLRDYLFMPLSVKFRRAGRWGQALALMITFLICGIWHEAGWTFLIWGGLHGLVMVAESLLIKKRKKGNEKYRIIRRIPGIMLTFLFLLFTWVLFRSPDLETAQHIFTSFWKQDHRGLIGVPVITPYSFLLSQMAVMLILLADLVRTGETFRKWSEKRWSRYLFVYLCLLMILLFGIFEQSDFVYTRF